MLNFRFYFSKDIKTICFFFIKMFNMSFKSKTYLKQYIWYMKFGLKKELGLTTPPPRADNVPFFYRFFKMRASCARCVLIYIVLNVWPLLANLSVEVVLSFLLLKHTWTFFRSAIFYNYNFKLTEIKISNIVDDWCWYLPK